MAILIEHVFARVVDVDVVADAISCFNLKGSTQELKYIWFKTSRFNNSDF